MSPSNHHYRRNRRRPPPTLARPSKYRTICDLPVELLCMIVSHVKSSRWTLRACTLACHCLRAVSLEHYFNTRLKVRDIRSFDHLISFLRAAPNIREKIRRLELSGQTEIGKVPHIALTSIDDTVVATLMQLLPNLTSLDINSMMYDTPASRSPPHVQQDKPGPFRLQSFSFDFYYTLSHNSSISGLFRILSLFSIDALSYSVRDFDTTSPFDLAFLHRPPEIKKLRISHCSPDENSGTSLLLDAFTESLEPESLESLRIEYGTGPEVLALGKLLARAGKALTSLSISGIHPFMLSERKPWHWVDPLNSHWRSLGLASCSKLRSIEIEIYFRYDEKPQDVPAYSLAGAGMLSQAPRTLRHVTIRLNYLPRVTTLNNRRMLRLQEFDKVITYDRFPDMKEVNLCILLDRYLEADRKYDWQHVVVGVQKALPNLHARGLLKVIKQSAFG